MSGRRLIHIVAGNSWMGRERYALDLCRYFASKGWRVTCYTRDANAVDCHFRAAGIDLRHAPLHGFLDWYSVMALARDLRHEDPGTIVHVHRYRDAMTVLAACKVAKRNDIKVVSTAHKVRRGIDSWIFKKVYKNISSLIFNSQICCDRFISTWRGRDLPFPKERIHVILNSIYLPDLRCPEPEPDKGPIVAMFHGSLLPGRGLETIIDSLPRLKGKKMRLWLVGNGNTDYIDTLRRRAINRGVMDMIDWKRHTDDPHQLIRRSHFGVFHPLSAEGLGMANLEFMANGRPQITTSHGATTEYLIDGENALLVNPSDTTALADAMLRLVSDAELRHKLGQSAYERFTGPLSWQEFARRVEEIYCSL